MKTPAKPDPVSAWANLARTLADGAFTARYYRLRGAAAIQPRPVSWRRGWGWGVVAAVCCCTALFSTQGQSLTEALDATGLVWATGGGANWFGQTSITHDGVDSAQSGVITNNQTVWMETTVTGPCRVLFWWKVSCEEGYDWLTAHVDDIPQQKITGEANWRQAELAVPEGLHTCRWAYSKDVSDSEGADAGWVDQIEFAPPLTLDEALDSTGLVWTTGGDAKWFPQAGTTHDGTDAAQSGGITDDQTNWLQMTVTWPCMLTFWWKVSSEEEYDFLEFHIDDEFKSSISGQMDWEQKAFFIAEGSHTCRWLYIKDGSGGEGADTGWVDQVQLGAAISLAEALDAMNVDWTSGGDVDWHGQGATSHDGADAAMSGDIGDDGESYFQTTVTGPALLSFWWTVSSEEDYDWLDIYIDDEFEDGISGEVDWQRKSLAIPEGSHTCLWLYSKDSSDSAGEDAGWVDQVVFSPLVALADALDAEDLVWTTGGDAGWLGQSAAAHDGADAAQSGNITDDGTSFFQTTVNGPGLVSFWWKVSSESGYDFLEFHVNGFILANISGEVDWQQASFPLPAGPCTLQWRYTKDSADSGGEDAGLVDQVLFTPTTGPAIVIIDQPRDQIAMLGDVAQFDVLALGTEPISYQWQHEGVNLAGQTDHQLRMQPVLADQAGSYKVAITNAAGDVTSTPAVLTLLPWELEWQKSYGGSGADASWAVCQTSDGGFLVGGSSDSTNGHRAGPFFGLNDFWVVRLNPNGSLAWEASFGGASHDYLGAVAAAADGGFLLAGSSISSVSGNKTSPNYGSHDFWIVRIDPLGNKLWDSSFGGNNHDHLWAVKALPDGGFALTGYSSSGDNGNKTSPNYGGTDFWLVRVDAAGNWLWDTSFGGDDDDDAYALDCTADGGFLLAGDSYSHVSGNKTSFNYGSSDFWVVRADANGNLLWDAAYGGTDDDYGYAVQPATGGGWWVGGESWSGPSGNKTSPAFEGADFWLVKADPTGLKTWDQNFGGSDSDYFYTMERTAGGELLLVGESFSGPGGTRTRPNFGGSDGWLVCLDASGQFLWDYAFGGWGDDWLATVHPAADGGFLLGAVSESGQTGNKTTPALGDWDFWPIKVRPYQAESAPELAVARTPGNGILLSWPANSAGWVLEWTNSLPYIAAPWPRIPPPYQANGTNLEFIELAPAGDCFYRLQKP